MHRAALLVAAAAALGFGIAGCGTDDGSSPTPQAKAAVPFPRYGPVDLPVIGRADAGSCRPGPTALESAKPGLVVVTGKKRQRVAGWGASVVTDTYVDPLVEPSGMSPSNLATLDRAVFQEGGVDIVRVFGPGYSHTPMDEPLERARATGRRFMFRAAALGAGSCSPAPTRRR